MCVCMALETHDSLPPFEFMSDEVVEQAFDVVAPLLASFGFKQPLLSKYKASWHINLCS